LKFVAALAAETTGASNPAAPGLGFCARSTGARRC